MSTSKALPPATVNVAGNAGAHEDADATGDVVDAGSIITTSPTADAGAGGTGDGQHQQHHNGHAP